MTALLAWLRALISAAPIAALLVGVLGSAFVSAGAGWKARDLKFEWWDKPAVQREQRAADVAEFQKVADEAEKKRALELAQLFDRWSVKIYEREVEEEAWDEARRELQQQEIKKYEQELREAGRLCPLTQRDLDFLAGLREKPDAGTEAGGGKIRQRGVGNPLAAAAR